MTDQSDPRLPTAPDPNASATPTNGMDPELPALPASLPASAITAFLRNLRNIRHYQDRPVPDEILHDILEVARWSGSAKNVQPWNFVVIRDRRTLDALAKQPGFVRHVDRAPLGIMLVMDGANDQIAQETFDEGRLTERIMLAADAHGLVSSIAWYGANGGPTSVAAKDILGISPERLVRTLISIGYPDREGHAADPNGLSGRKPLAETVHYDRW